MTDTTAATPAATPAPQLWEPSPGALEFVNNGIIRFHFPTGKDDDLVVRVRRPFLGELKDIRLDLEAIQDELAVTAATVSAEGQAMREEATALAEKLGSGEVTLEEHAEQLADIRRRDRDTARRMDDQREAKMLGWWSKIFGVLALDEVPDVMAYPAWILDARLPGRVLNHWRQIPSGPG